ncbi:hypothetical protein [Schumannella soli]|nr:hypothetical protein [Schumannella soli]
MKWLGRPREKLLRRLVFSAKERCDCGAGLAYDRRARDTAWDCSAILLGDALLVAGERGVADHRVPCSFFEVLSERSPAADGATTRPVADGATTRPVASA